MFVGRDNGFGELTFHEIFLLIRNGKSTFRYIYGASRK